MYEIDMEENEILIKTVYYLCGMFIYLFLHQEVCLGENKCDITSGSKYLLCNLKLRFHWRDMLGYVVQGITEVYGICDQGQHYFRKQITG